MLHQGTKTRVYEKLVSSLSRARRGKRDLDIVVSFVLGDTTSDAGKMIELLVEEGYPWDVISELLDEDLPAYTSSLDAALPGENVVLSAYAKKRGQWVAIHRTIGGEQVTAWAATECLARRLAALQAGRSPAAGAASPRPPQERRPIPPDAPTPQVGPAPRGGAGAAQSRPPAPKPAPAHANEMESGEEWRILF